MKQRSTLRLLFMLSTHQSDAHTQLYNLKIFELHQKI